MSSQPKRPPPPEPPERQPLSQVAIIDAAIELADHDGIGALSMRKLARRLGFEVMALYNHIANKNELMTLMVETIVAGIPAPPDDLAPLAAVRNMAMATRSALTKHPWASELWLKHLPGPARTSQMEFYLRNLYQSGLSNESAHHGFHAVTNHVHGYTLQEQGMTLGPDRESAEDQIHEYLARLSPDEHPFTIAHVHQHLEGHTASTFELVLDLILDGLVRLDESGNERGTS